jgi:hypothetical protein
MVAAAYYLPSLIARFIPPNAGGSSPCSVGGCNQASAVEDPVILGGLARNGCVYRSTAEACCCGAGVATHRTALGLQPS